MQWVSIIVVGINRRVEITQGITDREEECMGVFSRRWSKNRIIPLWNNIRVQCRYVYYTARAEMISQSIIIIAISSWSLLRAGIYIMEIKWRHLGAIFLELCWL